MKKYKRFYLTALSQRLCNLANKIKAQTIRFLTVTSWQNRFFPALSISAFLFAIKLASILCSFVLHRFGSLDNLPYEIVANIVDFLLLSRLPCNLALSAYFLQALRFFVNFIPCRSCGRRHCYALVSVRFVGAVFKVLVLGVNPLNIRLYAFFAFQLFELFNLIFSFRYIDFAIFCPFS